jgi:ribonuclease HII
VAGVSFPKTSWDFLETTIFLNDSKKLSAAKRKSFYETIKVYGNVRLGAASVDEIDRMNIVKATELATQRMLLKFDCPFQMALIDGIRKPRIDIPTTMIIKGDQKSFSIAAASIIAKVTRDLLMEKIGKFYPEYDFSKNAGYGTKKHQEALKAHGITPHHRKSYAPIKQILENL